MLVSIGISNLYIGNGWKSPNIHFKLVVWGSRKLKHGGWKTTLLRTITNQFLPMALLSRWFSSWYVIFPRKTTFIFRHNTICTVFFVFQWWYLVSIYFWKLIVTSRKPTYPLLQQLLNMIFLFPRWDMWLFPGGCSTCSRISWIKPPFSPKVDMAKGSKAPMVCLCWKRMGTNMASEWPKSMPKNCDLRETNIFAPENGWLEYKFSFGMDNFQGLVSFRECSSYQKTPA